MLRRRRSARLRIPRSAAEAEAALEDVYGQHRQRADRFHPPRGSARAYPLPLARSRPIDRLRTRDRRHRLRDQLPGSLTESTPVSPSPYVETLARERRARLGLALASLPAPQREAVELSFLEGLSHPEISVRLGEPLGTI
jgi:RNA polymerase sigma-70 factor (ECF subfamily)